MGPRVLPVLGVWINQLDSQQEEGEAPNMLLQLLLA